MLTSISPLGERARGNRWQVTVLWLGLGAVAGGAAVGAALGALGQVSVAGADSNVRLVLLAVACAGAAAWDLSGRRLPGRRQVNEDWLVAYRSWVYGAGFGVQLGAAVATVVNTALVPLFMLAALLAGEMTAGLLMGTAFGAVRGASLVLGRRVRTPDDLRHLHRRLDRHADRVRRMGAGVAVALAGAAAASLLAL
ncbi:MAG: hypothetical protein OXG40_01515 [Acidimicrobiaceae bacterium]|nr:hypothetical protein [Acidimicrobiaceae bacterium]MDE0517652.1 hypothetical protein [Acidimicrobiaceae bacterium]